MLRNRLRSIYNRTLGRKNDDELHNDNQSHRLLLGQHFSTLQDADHSVENHQINSLESEISQIGQSLSELSDRLNQIHCREDDQDQTISIGNNANILESQQRAIKNVKQTIEIKQSIGDHFQILNEKLNSYRALNVDDQLVPVLGSTLNQLTTAVRRIEATISNSNEVLTLNIGTHHQYLTNEMKNETTHFDANNEMNIQLACYSHILNDKLNELKTILYKRYKTRLKELINGLKLQYENDFDNYRKMNNLKSELNEFEQYCIRSNKTLAQIRVVFHEKLKNDLKFKHCFKRFLITYKQNLCQLLLIESIRFIPKSKLYRQASSNDEKYNLFEDIEQLQLIFDFLIKIIDLSDMKDFGNFVTNKTSIFHLFMKNIKNSNDFLVILKETYLVFVRDHILTLYDRKVNTAADDIQLKIDQMRQLNEEHLKLIHDSGRQMKKRFIQQFRGQTWDEKLIINITDINDYKVTELSMKKDTKVDQLKEKWLVTNDLDFYSEYENYILTMKDSAIKSRNLFEISQIYNDKQPRLNVYLKRAIEFLNKSIAIDEFQINSGNYDLTEISPLRTNLRLKYELRALIHLHMAGQYNFACFDKFNCFTMATFNFLRFDRSTINEFNVQYHENNFIQLFKSAFEANDDSSINIYDRILIINPYFFPAQYQKLLKYYQLNDCSKICHIHLSFRQLTESDSPLLDLFQILINKKKTKRKSKLNSPSDFLNRIVKIQIKYNQYTPLYLKLVRTEYSYQLKCSSEEQLINLLKYGKLNMNLIKDNDNTSLKLKYQLLNFDLQQTITKLNRKIASQEINFFNLIQLYKKLELTNETEYRGLNETFLKLLPETRLNFIRINSNCLQRMCEISRALREFQSFYHHDVNKQILRLKFERANIYRKNHLFHLEELELLEILNNQKKNSDHNPVIYYRLSYLNKQRTNLRIAMNYINLAKKKYYEKMNKPIFRKINSFKAELSVLGSRDLNFLEKNQLNLIQIWNLIRKFKLQSKISMLNGFQLFTSASNRVSLINCLFYHLIEDTNDIEQFLTDNPDHSLTRKFNDLQKMLEKHSENNRKSLVDSFNSTFQTKFQCLFLDENINSFDSKRIPIILFRENESRPYQTIKQINYYMFLTNLLTTYDAKKDLKTVCSKFLNEEIGKNILIDNKENKNIEIFIKSTISSEDMKTFSEGVVYCLKTNDYDENCFHFWSSIADFQHHIDIHDTLEYFKELFRLAIEEHRQEEEEKHKSALQLINDLIEQNQSQQNSLALFNRLKEEILQCLDQYENISSKSTIREKINEIISSNYELVGKLQKLIAKNCLNIDFKFENPDEEVQFYDYLKDKNQSDLLYKIFLVIEEILAKPKIATNGNVAVIDSYNLILSDLVNTLEQKLNDSNVEEVKFYGTNIFIDHSLNNDCWHGIHLFFASNTIHFLLDASGNKITLDVSGRLRQNGQHAEHQHHATRTSEDGLDGLPGENGEAGQNGGYIYLIARSRFDGKANLEKLITSGGDGGKGGNGGNAGNGMKGEDGAHASEEDKLGLIWRGYTHTAGKPGTRGGNGGVGGNAGLGGLGGHAGLVYIEEQQTVITDGFITLIESIDKSNDHAEDGLPGQGGKGGEGGFDGNDYIHFKAHQLFGSKEYRGHFKIINCRNTFFKCSIELEEEKKPKKPDGIDNAAGKSANMQLQSGKSRNKHENKNKSREEQMNGESDQIIHRNNEQSKNLSQNLSNSMNLLKDQMTDILDERQLKVKTHRLSDSMLDNAHKVAQEALALNTIKTKTKMENTILKTSEMDSDDKREKVSILTKMKFDVSEQEMIEFKKVYIIADLQHEYQKKIKHFHIHLTEDVKKVKHEIKALKATGKNIFFQTDIDNLRNTLLSIKHNENQLDLTNLFRNESTSNSLFNRALSSLIDSFRSFFYDSVTKSYKPFLLNQYFQQLNELKRQKRTLTQIKNQLNQLNIEQFMQDLCLEFGNQETIKKKLIEFDEIFRLDVSTQSHLFSIDDFIKQIYSSIDPSDNSQLVSIQNTTTAATFVRNIENFLVESNVSIERINEFLPHLSQILSEKSKFKQPELHECSPIYHKHNEQQIIEIHPIEELIYDFLRSKEKNLELIIRMLNSLFAILETNQESLLCKKKLQNFLLFLFINIIHIPIDFDHGHLFHMMRTILNSIQLNYSTSLFNKLELILLIKEKQFNDFQKCLNKVQIFFQHKQTEYNLEIQTLNYIQNNRKSDIFDLFKKFCKSATDNINQNENVQEFINNLYLEDNLKNQIQILLMLFHNYLTNIKDYEYCYLRTHKKLFLEKMNLFLKEQKRKIKANFNDLLLQQERSQNIVHRLYRSCNLQTNIQYLNDIDASTQLQVNEFIPKLKVLYDHLRSDEISLIEKVNQPKLNFIELDYNKNVCQISLLTRQINDSDRTQVKNGYQIIVLKEETNKFRIYFRDQNDHEIQNRMVNETDLMDLLNNFQINEEILLPKEENKLIYKMIYEQVALNHGFTNYSSEQIESFEKFKEMLQEKLDCLKINLEVEIESVLNSYLPEFWSQRIFLIFNNINITLKIQEKFPEDFTLTSTEPINQLNLTMSNACQNLSKIIENLLSENKQNTFIDFYRCLSTFDYLLMKILDNEFHHSIDYFTKDLSIDLEKKTNLEKIMLYEITLKNNQILQAYFLSRLTKIFDCRKEEILNGIDSLSCEIDIKYDLQQRTQLSFKDLILNACIRLLTSINQFYTQSCNRMSTVTRYQLYEQLIKFADEYNEIKIFDWEHTNKLCDNLDDFIETSYLLIDYLEKYSLISISGVMNIDYNENDVVIQNILNEWKNNSIEGKTFSFDQDMFIQVFFHRIMKNTDGIPMNIITNYLLSFETILKNSNLGCEVLILFDDYYRNQLEQIKNDELRQLLERFGLLITEQYNNLIRKIKVDFVRLMLSVKQKNRILNVIWKYLTSNTQDKNLPSMNLEKNQLNQVAARIQTIFEWNQFEIKELVNCYQTLNKSLLERPVICLQTFENQWKVLQFKSRIFAQNIDFDKHCPIKNLCTSFNDGLNKHKKIDYKLILNLLENVFQNRESFDSLHYVSIMKKILLNLQIDFQKFDLDFLSDVEKTVKINEKSLSTKKDYLNLIIELIKTEVMARYNQELKRYEEKRTSFNKLVQEILDVFWSNISMSDLLNKDREKVYLHLNIEKLLKLSDGNQNDILKDLLIKIKQLQTYSNKKQFTNDIHQYLNQKINEKIAYKIVMPAKLSAEIKASVENVLQANYKNENSELILNEFSILFEAAIDHFKDEPVFNDFFESCTNVFKYFSWRLYEYQPMTKQKKIDEAIERLNSSLKKFKMKLNNLSNKKPLEIYDKFYEFEKTMLLTNS